jgi:hypothetical protein
MKLAPKNQEVIENIIGKEITCHKCKHIWHTRSTYQYVSCPFMFAKSKGAINMTKNAGKIMKKTVYNISKRR